MKAPRFLAVLALFALALGSSGCASEPAASGSMTVAGARLVATEDGSIDVAVSTDASLGDWSASVGGTVSIDGPTVVATEQVAVVLLQATVVGLDRATGAERWRVGFERAEKVSDEPELRAAGASDVLLLAIDGARLIDAATGSVRWTREAHQFRDARRVVRMGDRLALLTSSGPIVIDRLTGERRWSRQDGDLLKLGTFPPLAGDDDGVYVPVFQRVEGPSGPVASAVIAALDPRDGSERWRSSIVGGASGLMVTEDLVIARIERSGLVAVHRGDGSAAWATTVATPTLDGDVAFYDDGSGVIGWVDAGGHAGGIDTRDGSVTWARDLGTRVRLPFGRCDCGRFDFAPVFSVSTPAGWFILDVSSGKEIRRSTLTQVGLREAVTSGWAVIAAASAPPTIRIYAFDAA